MVKLFQKNTKKYIQKEVELLEQEKELKLLKIQDTLHDYSVDKSNSKFSFRKTEANILIQNKRKHLKIKTAQITKRYDHSIKVIQSKGNKNYWSLLFTSYFRRLGLNNISRNILKFVNENKLMLIIILIAIIAGTLKPVFYSKYNILNNIIKNNSTIGLMAVGMTFVILIGGIDLSVGSILGLTGILSMGMILNGMNTILAFMIGFLIAFMLGAIQGLLIAWVRLPAFIVTLVGLLSVRGAIYIYAKGAPKTQVGNKVFDFINSGSFLGMPFLVWVLITFVFIGMIILKYTHFGRKVYSVGGNEEAAKLSGINTKKIILICYAISSLMAGIGSLAFVSKIASAGPTSGSAYELDVIAAVVLGGTSLSGGKGGIGKTFLGWLVISILANALVILGFDSNWQLVFKGLVILIAVILDKDLNVISQLKKIKNKVF